MDTKKASLPNTAIEELAEFVFNEAGDVTVARPLTGQEGLQMAGDDSIHGIVFWITGPVLGINGHEAIAVASPWAKPLHNRLSNFRGNRSEKSG